MTADPLVIGFLLVFILIREIISYKERQGLLDRIVARDLPELVQGEVDRVKAKRVGKMPIEKTVEL